MKKKFDVYLSAIAGVTVEVEVDVTDNMSDEDIASAAYEKAASLASLNDCEVADWDGEYEVNGTDFSYSEEG